MARPKKLTQAKIGPIMNQIEGIVSEYVSSEDDIESILSSLRETLSSCVASKDSPKDSIDKEIEGLSGVVDSRGLTRTGTSVNDEGFYVRTKGVSEKADGIKGL